MRAVSDEMVLTLSAGGTAIECSLVDDKPQARLDGRPGCRSRRCKMERFRAGNAGTGGSRLRGDGRREKRNVGRPGGRSGQTRRQ